MSSHKKESKAHSDSKQSNQPSNDGYLTDTAMIDFFKKYAFVIIAILLISFFAFTVRSGPSNLEGIEDRVEQGVYANIEQALKAQAQQQFPFSQQSQADFVETQLKKTIDTNQYQGQDLTPIIEGQIQATKAVLQADNGQTYFTALDPYYFYRIASNYLENGHPGTTQIDGVSYDMHKLAPEGASVGSEFHTWLEWKIFQSKGFDVTTPVGEKTQAVYFIPVILAILSGLICFTLLKKTTNTASALAASLLLVIIPTFVSRTVAGFVDTDGYVVLFSLLVSTLMILSIYQKKTGLAYVYAALAGLAHVLFLWSWASAWFLIFLLFTSVIGYGLLQLIFANKKQGLHTLGKGLTYFAVLAITYGLFLGRNILALLASVLSRGTELAGGTASSIWPNVLSSVAELNSASWSQIISTVGGKLVFFLALFGLLYLALDFKHDTKKVKIIRRIILFGGLVWMLQFVVPKFLFAKSLWALQANSSIVFLGLLFLPVAVGGLYHVIQKEISNGLYAAMFISAWVMGTLFMSLNGIRFILLLAPAFAVAFGYGIYYLVNFFDKYILDLVELPHKFKGFSLAIVPVFIIFLILWMPMLGTANQYDGVTPSFDDEWYDLMYEIRDNSSDDAIITSWWDFGHFFTAIAERGATFDGSSQGTPQAHWVGKFLLESDADVSQDILRMLVCGGNKAHATLLSYTDGDDADAVKINKVLYQTFGKNQVDTREVLETNKYYNLSADQVDEVIMYLACSEPVENYVITSADMVGKAAVWAHWGSWDFTKKYVQSNFNKMSVAEMAKAIDENESLIQQYVSELIQVEIQANQRNVPYDQMLNNWFAPYPRYLSGFVGCSNDTNLNLVLCQNGVIYNSSAESFQMNEQVTQQYAQQGIVAVVRAAMVAESGVSFREVVYDESGQIDVLLVKSGDTYQAMTIQAPLGTSLFTKLFYLNGVGVNNDGFEAFSTKQSLTTGKVSSWKINFAEN